MYAALFVLAQVIANPAPESPRVVLDGCNTASAVRTAEIRLMPAAHPHNRVLMNELLHEKDGATCLFETDVILDLHLSGKHDGVVARAFAAGLDSAPHVAERAHELLGKAGTIDPNRFGALLRRIDSLRNTARYIADDNNLRAVTASWVR